MAFIEGGNNPGFKVEVDKFGKLQARAVSITEQSQKSLSGDSYNINTGQITLTTDVETPLFYLRNDTEDDSLVIPRIFLSTLVSTGGVGEVRACVYANITGGTILAGADLVPQNFNFGSSKLPGTTLKAGATGVTFSGGTLKPEFLFPSDNRRDTVPFEAIILPRGASLLYTVTPPAGNTSWVLEAGSNFYIDGDF